MRWRSMTCGGQTAAIPCARPGHGLVEIAELDSVRRAMGLREARAKMTRVGEAIR